MDLVYKERRKQQMLRFFGATALTLISLRFTMRLLTTKVTKNSIFELNKNRCMFQSFFPPFTAYNVMCILY